MSTAQLEISFEAGLLDQFPSFHDCVRASVYGCGQRFKVIAAELDLSPSKLSRMLAEQGDLNFPLDLLPDLIAATGDKRPIYWLVEKFLEDTDARRDRALQALERLMPEITSLVSTLREDDK